MAATEALLLAKMISMNALAQRAAGRGLRGRACAFIATLGLSSILLAWSTISGLGGTMALPGKFAVSQMGAATYTIPIALPPGTAGVAPVLSLAYDSQAGNGLLGVGWALGGLPSIGRCPKTFAQDGVQGGVKYDANDRFCMDGQKLVAVSGAYGADGTQYRTEIETFSNIISHGTAGNGPAWFEVRSRSGQTMEFGHTPDSQILAQGKTTARTWALNKLSDTKGNYYAVTYANDAANGQYYPTRIDYTGNAGASVAPYNSVQFIYASRPDLIRRYQAGSLTQTSMRLTNIRTYAGNALVSDYRLTYELSGPANRSRMTSIVACEAGGSCLPATKLTWTSPTVGFAAASTWATCYGTTCGWTNNGTNPRALVDVNGDGLPDIVGFGGNGVTVSLNTGSGVGPAQIWNNCFGTGCSWSDNNVYPRTLADVNGDGLPDIVGFASSGVEVALNTGGSFAPAQEWIAAYGQSSGWSDNNTYPRVIVDVNGDGLPDVVGFSCCGVYVSLNTGTNFAAPQLWITAFGPSAGGWTDQNTAPRTLLDVNGDGLPDVVGFAAGGVYVSLNTGTSFATPQLWVAAYGSDASAGWWPSHDTVPRMLVDVNGDGLPDVVGFAGGGVYVSLNTGTSFATPQLWVAAYGSDASAGWWSSQTTVPRMLVDVNGDGLADVVGFAGAGVYVSLNTGSSFGTPQAWITGVYGSEASGGSWSSDNIYPRMVVDVAGTGFPGVVGFGGNAVDASPNTANIRPDLLSSVATGLGAMTTVSYVPATNRSVVTKGAGTVFPTFDLADPFYVVSRVDTNNGLGGTYSSTYAYSGGRLDTRGRGLLGFAQTTVTDLQTNISETTTYRQDFPYIGLASVTTRAINAQTLARSVNTYQFMNTVGTTTAGPANAPYRVSLAQNVASGSDLDGSALPTTVTSYQYDPFGNATQVVASTWNGSGWDGHTKTTSNTFTNDTTHWYLGQLTRTATTSTAPGDGSTPPVQSPAADLAVTITHTGSLSTGQTGASYTIAVSNVGTWPTSGAVSVTDTLPAGLTATSLAGVGWSCTLSALSCTRSDPSAGGASYPPITLTVNVAATAPASVTNVVTVSGGGDTNSANNTASDTALVGAPVSQAVTHQVTISSSTNNLNLWNYLIATGNATAGKADSWVITINSGVVIGSTSTGDYAFDTGVFPTYSTLQIVNYGTIVGAGGNGGNGLGGPCRSTAGFVTPLPGSPGGPALRVQTRVVVTNNGAIWGGGGGGSGSIGSRAGLSDVWSAGGGGGGGAGSVPGIGGADMRKTTVLSSTGQSGSLSAGGSGSRGGATGTTIPGADGGGPGSPGTGTYQLTPVGDGSQYAKVCVGTGGAAGSSVTGNSLASWVAVGDVRGPTN